jgi:hypothetical protein
MVRDVLLYRFGEKHRHGNLPNGSDTLRSRQTRPAIDDDDLTVNRDHFFGEPDTIHGKPERLTLSQTSSRTEKHQRAVLARHGTAQPHDLLGR